jgi:hypothetical protein
VTLRRPEVLTDLIEAEKLAAKLIKLSAAMIVARLGAMQSIIERLCIK